MPKGVRTFPIKGGQLLHFLHKAFYSFKSKASVDFFPWRCGWASVAVGKILTSRRLICHTPWNIMDPADRFVGLQVLDLWRAELEVAKAESKEKEVNTVQAPDTSREIGAASGSAPGFEVKSLLGERMEEGDFTPKQSSVLASLTSPEISLRNPRVEIKDTFQGGLVEQPTDNRSLGRLALDALPSATAVSICLHLSLSSSFFFEGFILLQSITDRMEAISVVKNLYEDVHKWKKAAEESKVLAVEASEQIRLLKEHRDETSSVLSDQEKQIATLEAVCMASQARIFRDLTKIRKLERDLKLASRNALEEFKKSSSLSLYKAAIAKYKASGAFQNELDRAMKQLQDSSMTRARGEGELREIISRIVEDVHLQCPHIDFLKVREIGAFGEYHLAVTGKRKPDIPESSAGEGSSSKKHH